MNNKAINNYTVCCSTLEKIASKRKIYASESILRLNKKDSKTNVPRETVLREVKGKNRNIPFICASSANKSHHIGINIQTTMSMIKQFPAQNFDEHTNSRSTTASSKFIGKHSETNLSQHFPEIHVCPAVSMEETTITNQDDDDDSDDDGAFDENKPNPWAVTQSDGRVIFERTNHQRNSCFCPSHSMDSYNKVMVPFVKQLKRSKNSSETSLNPYTKTKIVHNYELLARRIQELQQIVTTMKTELGKQFQKYRKLYEQHIKNQNGKLIPILLQTEDKINALKSRVNEAVELYNEVAIIDVHFAEPDSSSSSELLTVIESSLRKGPKPKETTATRLIRVMRRVQQLQDKLKSGHYRHYGSGGGGGGDHAD